MASNRYPGYCVDCGRDVRANHGELVKRGGKWVVSCGKGSRKAVPAAEPKPKVIAPEGNRLRDLTISSSNACLTVKFSVEGLGHAYSLAPWAMATAIKYSRWEAEGSLRANRPEEAADHDAACEANEKLHAQLKAQGQVAYDSEHEFSFPLSAEETATLAKLIDETKARMLDAILDGSATVDVHEVGCDFPHQSICGVAIGEEKIEWALMYETLRSLNIAVDNSDACKDLAAVIRQRQQAQIERDEKLAEHKRRRAAGYHVVLLQRCWECGRTRILGEYDDDMHVVRMPAEVYTACLDEQKQAHARSLAAVPAGTILSSVGFEPAAESKFEFRIERSDWYCGC
jgi:hypothetical protein